MGLSFNDFLFPFPLLSSFLSASGVDRSVNSAGGSPKLVLVCNEDAGVTRDGTEAFAMRLFMTTYINMSTKMNNLAFVAKRALQTHCPGILVTNEDK